MLYIDFPSILTDAETGAPYALVYRDEADRSWYAAEPTPYGPGRQIAGPVHSQRIAERLAKREHRKAGAR